MGEGSAEQKGARSSRVPVTVVTGFLGSGKTTLINRILSEQHGRKIAVIVNEFGEVSIDGQLILSDDQEDLVEFNNGCLCCTVRGDLVDTLAKLKSRTELDAILIETTGLADPPLSPRPSSSRRRSARKPSSIPSSLWPMRSTSSAIWSKATKRKSRSHSPTSFC